VAFLHFAITLSCRPSAEPVAMARGPRATPAWGPCVRVRSRSQPSLALSVDLLSPFLAAVLSNQVCGLSCERLRINWPADRACLRPRTGSSLLSRWSAFLATLLKTCTYLESAPSDVGTTACLCVSHTQHLLPAAPLGLLLGLAPAGGSGFYFFNVSLSLCMY